MLQACSMSALPLTFTDLQLHRRLHAQPNCRHNVCYSSYDRQSQPQRLLRTDKSRAAPAAAASLRCRRRCRGTAECSSHPVAAAAAAAWSSEGLFVASTLYCVPLCLLIVLAPRWRTAYRLLLSDAVFVPLALAYVVLLVRSWQPDTLSLMMPGSLAEGFAGGRMQVQWIPKLEGIRQLFSRASTAASLWVHLLAINMFAARWIMLDGLRYGVATLHSVLVAAVFGPLGVCSHFLTQVLFVKRSAAAEA